MSWLTIGERGFMSIGLKASAKAHRMHASASGGSTRNGAGNASAPSEDRREGSIDQKETNVVGRISRLEEVNREFELESRLLADEAQRLRLVNRFAVALAAKEGLDESLRCLAEWVVAELSFEECSVYLLNRGSKGLDRRVLCRQGPNGPLFISKPPRSARDGQGIARGAAAGARIEVVEDASRGHRSEPGPRLQLAVPLTCDEEVIGVVDCFCRRGDVPIVQRKKALSGLTGLAAGWYRNLLENERLHGECEERREMAEDFEQRWERERSRREDSEADLQARSQLMRSAASELSKSANGLRGLARGAAEAQSGSLQADLEALHSYADAIADGLDDMIGYWGLRDESLQPQNETLDLRKIAKEVVSASRAKATQAGIPLLLEIDSLLPPRLVCDPARVRRLLKGLLACAIDLSRGESVSLQLTGGEEESGNNRLRAGVRSSGLSSSAAQIGSLLSLLARTPEQPGQGSLGPAGVRLAVAANLAQAMGGQLTFDEIENTLTADLPFAAAGDGDADSELPRIRADGAPGQSGAKSVHALLVEDNPVNSLVASKMLSKLGCRVDMVSNGAEALEAVQRQSYDIVFMDCQMPVMDGYAATREIRSREGRSPRSPRSLIVAMTAHAMRGDRDKCLRSGMDDYLSKPINLNDLRKTLEKWTHHRGRD